ncbi:hypothetical protein Z043_109117 [Scleropages formosus]|uniref:Inositol-polyphosphate 5-phosphatase n=1 Tax=Scleropages formosus TaxID=113540 RepID=A0A0P7UCV2_SCLFO|nr:hypothetical protein Z043_109117 [Scleropages formosus]
MGTHTAVLLVTANVGSLFDHRENPNSSRLSALHNYGAGHAAVLKRSARHNKGAKRPGRETSLSAVGEIENQWLRELLTTVQAHKPRFVALHFQEVGGKDYMINMSHAENFLWKIESSEEMRDFDRACIYMDNNFKAADSFTALGSMYFIHKSLKNIHQYDFSGK